MTIWVIMFSISLTGADKCPSKATVCRLQLADEERSVSPQNCPTALQFSTILSVPHQPCTNVHSMHVVILSLSSCIIFSMAEENVDAKDLANFTDPNTDMYVIHAMVYQVGILTNKTDNEATNASIAGNQEAVTFYRTNGSNLDLSNIPNPLQTNVTAQTLVGVAPEPANKSLLPWTALGNLSTMQAMQQGETGQSRTSRQSIDQHVVEDSDEPKRTTNNNLSFFDALNKRSVDTSESLQKGGRTNEKTSVKVVEGTSVIPQEAGVQSIALPPLLTLNNNFSEIPVPIPNTSVVRYAKINTLVHMP